MINQIIVTYLCVIMLIFNAQLGNSDDFWPPRQKYKVVIVGAGISAIGAATKLVQNNITDILILEGSNRVGGRMYTYPFADFVVELGCQWVHGQVGNPVYEIAQPHGVLYIQSSDLVPTLMKHSHSEIDMNVARPLFKQALDLFENDEKMTACNCSMETYFNKEYNKLCREMNANESTKEAVKDLIIKVQGIEDGTDDLDMEGTVGNTNYWIPLGSVSVAWKSGYHTLIDMLTGKYFNNELPVMNKIRFNKVVEHIDWGGHEIDITCDDGTQFSADHVIVTVSLGVLKNSAKKMFTPSLPPRKLSAIENLGFDAVNKVFIEFNVRWWPLQYDFHRNFLWSDEDKKRFKSTSRHGGWATEITSFHYVENQPRVLEGWILGDAAILIEHMTEQEVLDGCMEQLYWFFGDKYHISEPIDFVRTQWASNRFVRGAYSFPTTLSDHLGLAPSDLAEPLMHYKKPVVLFAGEATHSHHFSTVHGALETGWREAQRIIDCVN